MTDTVDKDRIIREWAAQNPYLKGALLFDFLNARPNSCAIVPIPGEAAVETYLDGSALMQYDFALQIMRQSSDAAGDTTNTDNMYIQRKWQDWIGVQEAAGNYPDFGDRCSSYELVNLANMPAMAGRQENGMTKYQFPARLTYMEVK